MSDGSVPKVLLWIRHAPHSTVHLSEAIRLASMGNAMGGSYRLLFIAEGDRALLGGQEAYRLGPPIDRLLVDIVRPERPALVHRPCLVRRGLERSSLVSRVPIEAVGDSEAAEALRDADRVVPF